MDIIEITPDEYKKAIGDDNLVFLESEFLELNKDKTDKIHYLIGKDSKNRVAVALGEKENTWKAPFSAPFGGFIFLQKDTSVEVVWEFTKELINHAKSFGVNRIDLYLPADIYGAQNNTIVINSLLGNGFKLDYLDINYSFDLNAIDLDTYSNCIQRNARKNLRIALQSDLTMVHCESDGQKREAYETIRINREHRGFPLRMTCEQLMNTVNIVDHNFFLVKHENQTVASAVVYNLNNKCAQVVYWGEVPDVSQLKSINFISYNLVKFYKERNYEILDIGISTEFGIPNFGLCSFKESIGCIVSNKYKFHIDL